MARERSEATLEWVAALATLTWAPLDTRHPKERAMLVKSIALVACCLSACVNPVTYQPPGQAVTAEHPPPTSAPGPDYAAYVDAGSADELAQLVERELSQRDFESAYEGLQRFMEANVLAGHETRASLILQQLRPV